MKIANRTKGQLFFFLFWPFGSLLYSASHFRDSISKNIVWLFAAFLGFTIVIPPGNIDAYRYILEFQDIAKRDLSFSNSLFTYFKSAESLDIYKSMIMWIVSSFTDNYRVFFVFQGLIFGYFYSRNIWFVLDRLSGAVRFQTFLFILTFAFIIPIFDLQFLRFGTATQVFIFGVLVLLGQGRSSGLWWAAGSILIHFSFALPVGLLILYKILPQRLNIYFVLFIISTLVVEVDLSQLREFMMNHLPSLLQPKVESYTNLKYAEAFEKEIGSTNWYIQYPSILFKYLSYGLIMLIFFKGKDFLTQNSEYLSIFCFVLFLYSTVNIISVVPSGSRFLRPTLALLLVSVIQYFDTARTTLLIRTIKIVSIPVLMLYIIVGLRFGLDRMSLQTLFGNSLTAMLINDNTPVIDYIKEIF